MNRHYHRIFWGILALLCLTAFAPEYTSYVFPENTQEQDKKQALLAYVKQITGTWVSEETAPVDTPPDLIWLTVREEWIDGDRIKIKVSEYCGPDKAEFLWFELKEGSLHYVAADDGKHIWPLMYLEFIELTYIREAGEPILYFESCEAEMQNHLNKRMIRIQEPTFNTVL